MGPEWIIAGVAVCTLGLTAYGVFRVHTLSVSVDGRLTQLLEAKYNLGAAEQANGTATPTSQPANPSPKE
jgi:hypothetical protein